MKHKVVIADDSTSIQKFAKITLASEGFDVVSCLKADELMSAIQQYNPAVVLLDFNLSDSKTGYDLAREIKSISNAKVILLYGTFDTIDDSLFADAGVNAHLVKPFDENKLLNLCRQQISDSELDGDLENIPDEILTEKANEAPAEDTASDNISIDEEWVVNQPEVQESEIEEVTVSKEELNSLEAGMEDWGIDVPNIIGQSAKSIELPPVIGEVSSAPVKMSLNTVAQESVAQEIIETVDTSSENISDMPAVIDEAIEDVGISFEEIEEPVEVSEEVEVPEEVENSADIGESTDVFNLNDVQLAQEEDAKVPEDSDLEYPDVDQVKKEIELELGDTFDSELELSSDFEVNEDEVTDGIGLDDTLGTNTDEEVEILKQQIADETGDNVSWETDEVITKEKPSMEDSLAKAREFFNDDNKPSAFEDEEDSKEGISMPSQAEIQNQIERMLVPMVEKMVNEKIDRIIEKVSWEIIPDLAENLIKKELQKVTKEVLEGE